MSDISGDHVGQRFPSIACVRFEASVPVGWTFEEAFVNEIRGTILGMEQDDSESREKEVGSISLLKVSDTSACNLGLSLADVCDAHSDFLEGLYAVFFDNDLDTKQDLEIEPGWKDILVFKSFNLDTAFRRPSEIVRILQTAINFLGPSDLVIGTSDLLLGLSIDAIKGLGFVKAAGSNFMFVDTQKLNPYRPDRPTK